MKRDMALIRRIMEAYENSNFSDVDTDTKEVDAHLQLLVDAGLIEPSYARLTWKGHDWLDEQRANQEPQHPHHFLIPEDKANEVNALLKYGKCRRCGAEFSKISALDECQVGENGCPNNYPLTVGDRAALLPHEPDDQGVCKWCDKTVLKPEMNEVCRRRRGEVSDRPIKPMDFIGGVQ